MILTTGGHRARKNAGLWTRRIREQLSTKHEHPTHARIFAAADGSCADAGRFSCAHASQACPKQTVSMLSEQIFDLCECGDSAALEELLIDGAKRSGRQLLASAITQYVEVSTVVVARHSVNFSSGAVEIGNPAWSHTTRRRRTYLLLRHHSALLQPTTPTPAHRQEEYEDGRTNNVVSAAHVAVMCGHTDCLRLLLLHGGGAAVTLLTDGNGREATPLHAACEMLSVDCLCGAASAGRRRPQCL